MHTFLHIWPMLLAFLGMGIIAVFSVWVADSILERKDQRKRDRARLVRSDK